MNYRALFCGMKKFLRIHPEVALALGKNKPVVALESTILAHGMPYPENITMAKEVGAIIREHGAIPATIACLDGFLHIGLSDEQMLRIAADPNVMKVSRRDLPYALAQRKAAATTVASTMIAADLAGIRVFVTGGIGGVHREWQNSLDISSDLIELSKTSVAVVSAGAKAILDIPATLELLETLGVPVLSYKEDCFGAFYSKSSGIKLEMICESPDEIAKIIHTKWTMGLSGGVLISNAIPQTEEIDATVIEPIIGEAVHSAKKQGIEGKALTPFLLATIKKNTEGESLRANIALVRNNAKLGAQVARQLSKLKR